MFREAGARLERTFRNRIRTVPVKLVWPGLPSLPRGCARGSGPDFFPPEAHRHSSRSSLTPKRSPSCRALLTA
jgi:hypothetical protein